MSHQDQVRASAFKSSELLKVMQWVLHEIVFEKKLHMNCSWTFRTLVMTALFWAWSREATMTERFACSQRLTRHLDKSKKKTTSSQAFLEMLRRHELRSTMMTSNRPLEDWGKLIGDIPAATAILDRFLQDAEVIQITGRSYRLRGKSADEKEACSKPAKPANRLRREKA